MTENRLVSIYNPGEVKASYPRANRREGQAAPIRVTHVTTAHRPFDIRIFQKECRALADAGYAVTLVVPHERDETIDGVRIQGLRRPRSRADRMLLLPWEAMRAALKGNPAVVHIHDPELLPSSLFALMRGARVIYDSHEDTPRAIMSRQYLPRALRRFVAAVFEALEVFVARRVNAVVAATPTIRDRFKRHARLCVDVNNYPMSSEFAAVSSAPWEQRGATVCYVGGISEQRGLTQMLHAVARTSSRLILAGDFSSARERQDAMASSAWDKVDYRGVVDRTEVAQILGQSTAGLVLFHAEPNHVFSQPTKLFEYMAAGLPVVASNFALWRSIVEDLSCGICVDPMDPAAVADAIEFLSLNPRTAEEMGRRGREAVETRYCWSNEAGRLLGIYDEIFRCEGRSGGEQ